MKSVFDIETRDELIKRINSVNKESQSQWGKMNVYQMLMHCSAWDEMIFGKHKVKHMFLGYLFGKIALKSVLKNEAPLMKNSPTAPELKITDKDGNVDLQKEKWIMGIKGYENFNNSDFIHPFFGKMTRDEIGLMVYKHTDHHLRQFGA